MEPLKSKGINNSPDVDFHSYKFCRQYGGIKIGDTRGKENDQREQGAVVGREVLIRVVGWVGHARQGGSITGRVLNRKR